MKKIRSTVAVILLVSLCLCGLWACTSKDKGVETTEIPTKELTNIPEDSKTEEPSDLTSEEPSEAPTEEVTEPGSEASGPKELALGWVYGYVGSSTNSGYTNVFNPAGKYYSTSDIICIEKAGTVISFTDDNTESNGDTGFISKSAYVISSWKKEGNGWVVDASATNVPGSLGEASEYAEPKDGAMVYTYTTKKDNENIRLSYRSGATDTFTPKKFPAVTYVTTGKITTEKATTGSPVVVDPPVAGKTEVAVSWGLGYVGSSTNGSWTNKLNPGGTYYSVTEVFTVEKAGTRITFSDDNTNSFGDTAFASNAAYVVSSWKKSGDNWVIDIFGANIPGSGSANSVIATSANGIVTYSYVTAKDNENLRLCFRSGEKTNQKPAAYPKVYAEVTGEPGTMSSVMASDAAIKAFLDESKKTTNYSVLEGITMNVIGDSYFAGHTLDPKYVWPSLLAQKYNMTFENYGRNGSTMSDYVTTNNPMVLRFSSMDNNNPNIVVIEGGRNDYNKDVPMGENGSVDSKNFKGAVRTLINGVKAKYPNALVICVTVWNVPNTTNNVGKNTQDYGKAMIEVCNDMGVPCFNAMDTSVCPVDMGSETFRTKYCVKPTDISHLNLEGHKLALTAFEKFIADAYTAFLAAK